jgi:hypothetical protein
MSLVSFIYQLFHSFKRNRRSKDFTWPQQATGDTVYVRIAGIGDRSIEIGKTQALASTASRRPSPRKLKARTVMKMATPGARSQG